MARDGCAFPRCSCTGICTLSAVEQSIIQRHHGRHCPYCRHLMDTRSRRLSPSRDHVHPRSRGGSDDGANILIVCSKCNNDKGNLTLAEFAATLEWRRDRRALYVRQLVMARQQTALHPAEAAE